MMYGAFQAQTDFWEPLRAAARMANAWADWSGYTDSLPGRHFAAFTHLFGETRLTAERPPFGIDSVKVRGEVLPVREEVADRTPFATLVRFAKDTRHKQPRVLVAAPLSGHFATLLRDTVKTLLADNEVYLTDWHNARDVPVAAGPFGFDEYVDHIARFQRAIGEGGHLLGVCQPCNAALAAAAVMAQGGDAALPRTITLMAGPVDARINPTEVNHLATSKPIEWFERNLIATVPGRYAGAGRRVYPGFVQLSAFMAMNLKRHVRTHLDLYDHIVRGDHAKVAQVREFYDEYFAVLDLAAEFYLETVRLVFQEHALARGELRVRGAKVEPRAIRRAALLTVEGEKDDICAVGQTLAAHDLCAGVPRSRRKHHLQAGVGHYGVFSGSKWRGQIYPLVRNHILAHD